MDSSPIPTLLLLATLLPLFSFWVILIAGTKLGRSAAYVSISAILGAAALSYISLFLWLGDHWPSAPHHGGHGDVEDAATDHVPLVRPVSFVTEEHSPAHNRTPIETQAQADAFHDDAGHSSAGHGIGGHSSARRAEHHSNDEEHDAHATPVLTGVFYRLARFGDLKIDFSYYVDALTICMFCMVTLIASCIHFYASGYMQDEVVDVHDHEVHLANGEELVRPGRFFRFFQYLSLFCFSMLGLVLSGNIFLVFVFWELVGICSYFLIGFYVERKSASTAANKAFIVNRVGDFGMIIGLMALWSSLGTFSFGDIDGERGLFSLIRSRDNEHRLVVPDSLIAAAASREIGQAVAEHPAAYESQRALHIVRADKIAELREAASDGTGPVYGYWLLVVGGVGIFCGCIGKSAQFPLHTWLPDAMEGPTPVSALVHSATMVAAGVYLTGRFYPMFLPEVLLVIASVGCITLFVGATIAITATDIKRVLAYSTISQLGYMMLSLGVGGWLAGLMHLITHAFFKSLLFMCSGSVIHAVHTNDMRLMGGLLRKMPVTAITMLIGCLAIAGVGLPFVVGFSGYYSKDMILEQAFSLYLRNNTGGSAVFFFAAAGGAAITAFYMFRMWYLTFVGRPRDVDRFDHAHESPPIMFVPLVILSVFAIAVAWDLRMIGYAVIPAIFLLVQGNRSGWFKAAAHDEGAHLLHGAHSLREQGLAVGAHGHVHAAGDSAHIGQAASHNPAHQSSTVVVASSVSTSGTTSAVITDPHVGFVPAEKHLEVDPPSDAHVGHTDLPTHASVLPGVSWIWIATMLLVSVVGGRVLELVIRNTSLDDLPVFNLTLANMLEQARPAGTATDASGIWLDWTWPNEHYAHEPAQYSRIVVPVTLLATGTWVFGIGLATLMYGLGYLSPEEVRRQFQPAYRLLVNKWYFDELYDALFVQPVHLLARFISSIDRDWIDRFLNGLARTTVWFARGWDKWADRTLIDGFVNVMGGWIYSLGLQTRTLQTGRLRQYVMFIVIGALSVFVLVSFFWNSAVAR